MKKFAILLIGLLAFNNSQACDICGGAASITGANGVIPFFNINQFSLSFGQSKMKHPITSYNTFVNQRVIRDELSTVNLQGMLFVHPKWQLQTTLPYVFNERILENNSQVVNGIGDIQILANYLLVNQSDSSKKRIKSLIFLGGGFDLPTGKYQQRSNDLTLYPMGLQAGSGAFSYIFQQQSSFRYQSWGLLLNSRVAINQENEIFYQQGNNIFNQLNIFKILKKANNQWIPQLGINSLMSKTDLKNKREVPGTSINSWSGMAAISWFYKKWNVQLNGNLPINQRLSYIQPRQEVSFSFRLGYLLFKE